MVIFKKWFSEHMKKALVMHPTLPVEGLERKYEAVWRAALEWAENQFAGKSAFQAEEAINRELRELED